jgi:uncharacterized protein YkwD
MGIRFFRGQKTRFEHEYRQLREIVELLRREYPREPVYLLTSVLVANGQIDCIILTRKGPLILELKAFRGEVHGLENGTWEVITGDGAIPLPNFFLQAKIHRQDFIDRLIPICREHFPHIRESNLRRTGSWLYFCRGSTYPEGQVDFRKVKWFRIATADTLIQQMRFLDSGYTLRIQDMDAIAGGLRLQEYSFETDHPLVPAERKRARPLVSRSALITILIIFVVFFAATAFVLIVPGARIAVANMIQGGAALAGGFVQSVAKDTFKANTTSDDSQQAMIYLNRIRLSGGEPPIAYDPRAYQLALARARDMEQYGYLNYTNPVTNVSVSTLKERFGFSGDEMVLENAYGQWNGYTLGIERQAIDSWVSDQGNRQRLFFNHTAGAVACSGGYCSFIGVWSPGVSGGLPGSAPIPVMNSTDPD